MKRMKSQRFTFLLAVLAIVSAWWVFETFQNRAMAKELTPLTAQHAAEFKTADTKVATRVTVTRQYVFVGDPLAKIAVFVKDKGDSKIAKLREIDFDYRREGGKWTLVDSGRCSSKECQVRARDAFQKSVSR